jgi:hypothetical protein
MPLSSLPFLIIAEKEAIYEARALPPTCSEKQVAVKKKVPNV